MLWLRIAMHTWPGFLVNEEGDTRMLPNLAMLLCSHYFVQHCALPAVAIRVHGHPAKQRTNYNA
jgi:hypothetical protein